jgi:hypothetical protein
MVKDCPHPPVKSVRVGEEVENKNVNSSYLCPNWGKGGVFKSTQDPHLANTMQGTDQENNVKSLACLTKFPLVNVAPVLSEETGLGLAPTLSPRGACCAAKSKKLGARTPSQVELLTLLSPEHTSGENKDLSSGRVEDIFDTAWCLTPTSRENVKLNPLDTSLVLPSDVPQITPVLGESGKNKQGGMVTTNILPSSIAEQVLFENPDLSVVTKSVS